MRRLDRKKESSGRPVTKVLPDDHAALGQELVTLLSGALGLAVPEKPGTFGP